MTLTDIITIPELKQFLALTMARDSSEEELNKAWRARADRLMPILETFAETLPDPGDGLLRAHMLAMIVALDEVIEHATTPKGRIQ